MYSFQPDIYISSVKDVYQYYSQEEIFKLVFGELPDYNKKYTNPLRMDNNPTCYFIMKNEIIYFVDWVTGTMDAIELIKQFYGLDLLSAINFIKQSAGDAVVLKSGCRSNHIISQSSKSPTIIVPHKRKWELRDTRYWTDRYGITEAHLVEDGVFPISMISIRKNDVWKNLSVTDIGYAITAEDKCKIYRPLAVKKSKWLSNTSKDAILGKYNSPNKSIVITKSYKDYRVIYNLVGGNVVWLQSEGSVPSKINEFLVPFDEIVILYDNDSAGTYASKRLAKIIKKPTRLIYSEITYIKDISEMYCFKGKQFTEQWLKNTLNAGESS